MSQKRVHFRCGSEAFLWGQSGTYVTMVCICIRMKIGLKIARFNLLFVIRYESYLSDPEICHV